jgi:hypothetical protein
VDGVNPYKRGGDDFEVGDKACCELRGTDMRAISDFSPVARRLITTAANSPKTLCSVGR